VILKSTLPGNNRAAWAQFFVEINGVGRFACRCRAACKDQLRGKPAAEPAAKWFHPGRRWHASPTQRIDESDSRSDNCSAQFAGRQTSKEPGSLGFAFARQPRRPSLPWGSPLNDQAAPL